MPLAGQAQPFNRKQPNKVKKNRFAHVQNTKYGMGDNYGLGVKAKMGRIIEGSGMHKLNKRQIGTPPKGLA